MTHTLSTPRARRHPPLAGEVVLGVDTHRDAHVAAAVSSPGAVIGTETFPATAAGYRQLLEWASRLGTVCRAGVEGTGSYGAALSRYLLAQHVEVFEVNRPDRTVRRRRGKSDMADAQAAAQAVLSGRAQARAKSGDGPVQIARMFKLAKDSAVKARTQAINQLKAVLVTADTPSCAKNCRRAMRHAACLRCGPAASLLPGPV
ncbi:transposase [Streptomyces sp. NPDC001820]|uniref:IS110 family transposase n=1 Tax=Streptomyces sp. NPDC001820 TaxID=3364613 RepID=UPI0036872058